MSRLLAGVTIVTFVLPIAACQSGGDAADTAGVTKAKDAYFAAWTKKDGETFTTKPLAGIMDTSPDFLSIDGMAPTPVLDGWKTYEATWATGINQFKSTQMFEVATKRTWIEGAMATTVSECRITGTLPDGNKLDMNAFTTLVYRKRNNEWRIVHENTNLPPNH